MKTKTTLKPLALIMVLISWTAVISANGQSILDDYITQGLKQNIVLQEKQITLKQAEQSLQIARSYFLPTVNLLGDYTSGKGGRSIALPIGDLLNPVYASLNQLTGSDNFPQVENVEQSFFPYNFYDARVRTSMPLINTDLHINRTINGQKVQLRESELNAYKRELVFEIKKAYYNYLSAISAEKIYESAKSLVDKNVSVNESLLRNGKNLPANLLRAKSEAEKIKADLNNARSQVSNAKKYFNFLLNKDLDSEISIDEGLEHADSIAPEGDVTQREELAMLRTVQDINELSLQLQRLSRLPKVSGFLDLGTQSSDWRFNDDSRYYLVGVQLSLPIFQGFRTNTQIRQSKLEIEKSNLDLRNTASRLQVAADISRGNFITAKANYKAAVEQLASAKSYFNLLEKGFQQGVNSQIEFIDARNQLTSSELQLTLRLFEMLTAAASLERETSSFNLQN